MPRTLKASAVALAAILAALVLWGVLSGQAVMGRKSGNDAERYLATSSAQGSFALTAGRTTTSPAVADTRAIVSLGQGFRGVRLTFFGSGADNATFDYRVWRIERGMYSRPWHQPGVTGYGGDWSLEYYGGGTATLSTAVGGASSLVPVTSSERIADTVTWTVASTATTPKGTGSLIEASNLLGSSWVYSPADNTPAVLSIPDLDGAYGVLIEFDLTGATAANCLVTVTP